MSGSLWENKVYDRDYELLFYFNLFGNELFQLIGEFISEVMSKWVSLWVGYPYEWISIILVNEGNIKWAYE